MENKKMITMFAFGVMALLAVSLVAAHGGGYLGNGSNYSDERQEAMQDVFEDLDYDAWVALMAENGMYSRMAEVVTEDNFEVFAEMHESMMSGDYETAAELRSDLGLNSRMGPKDGSGFRRGAGHEGREGCGLRN